MRAVIGRSTLFFLFLAAICLALVAPTPPEFRWVAWFASGLAAFWAVAYSIEDLAKLRQPRPRDPAKTEPGDQ